MTQLRVLMLLFWRETLEEKSIREARSVVVVVVVLLQRFN
jgi:hypothetical protein